MESTFDLSEKEKWNLVLQKIKADSMPAIYSTWIKPLRFISADEQNKEIRLTTNSTLSIGILRNRYMPIIKQAVLEVYGFDMEIIVSQGYEPENGGESEKQSDLPYQFEENALNPRYNFDTFVVGSNNELAYAACRAVAKGPASVNSNPLFIYGNSGLGKTHLMNAIGHYVQQNDPARRVLYLSSETFTNELVNALQSHEMDRFREKYRNIDILMIDDIQFIEKKESTQTELFHTFNTLYETNRQIVFTSDRPPKDISTIDQRLKSRFEWGLSVDIQPPDFETRVAILKNKAEMEDIEVNDEMLEIFYFIAEKITTNIRELEGALNTVIAHANLTNKPLTRKMAGEVLKGVFNTKNRTVDIPLIKNTVCAYYNINVQDMDSSKRTKNLAHPRQIAMYLCRELTDTSLPKIGKNFGNRDHTTVIHACEKISKEIKTDEELKKDIEKLKSSIMDI